MVTVTYFPAFRQPSRIATSACALPTPAQEGASKRCQLTAPSRGAVAKAQQRLKEGSMTRNRHLLETVAVIATVCGFIGLSNPTFAQSASSTGGGSVILPVPPSPFGGVIGRKASESTPDFPQAVT